MVSPTTAVPHVIFEPVLDYQEVMMLNRVCELVTVAKYATLFVRGESLRFFASIRVVLFL